MILFRCSKLLFDAFYYLVESDAVKLYVLRCIVLHQFRATGDTFRYNHSIFPLLGLLLCFYFRGALRLSLF